MNEIITTSLQNFRRNRALWLYLLIFAAAISMALFSAAAQAQSQAAKAGSAFVSIGSGGTYERDALPRTTGWQGLFCNDKGCELRKARVRIVLSEQEDISGDMQGAEELLIDDSPLAVFNGLNLTNGPVSTTFRLAASSFESNQYRSLRKLGRWQIPGGSESLTLSWVKLVEYGGFRYHLSSGAKDAKKQFLFRTDLEGHYGDDTTPVIHWAGDLDGDGKTDFLVSLPGESCWHDERLYLSSLARDGEYVGKAAQFSGGVPACGC